MHSATKRPSATSILKYLVFFGLISVVTGLWVNASGAATTTVETKNNLFVPADFTVKAGDTVTFKNVDQVPHNVTAKDGSFKIDLLNAGESKPIQFSKAGTFDYVCSFHPPNMKGKVTVEAAAVAAPATSPSPAAAAGASPSASAEAGPPPPPTEHYFPKIALGLTVLLVGAVGMMYVRTAMKTAESRRS